MTKQKGKLDQSLIDIASEASDYFFSRHYGEPSSELLKKMTTLLALRIVQLTNPDKLITRAKLSEEMCSVLDGFMWFSKNQIFTVEEQELLNILNNDSLGG